MINIIKFCFVFFRSRFKMMLLAQGPGLGPSVFESSSSSAVVSQLKSEVVVEEILVVAARGQKEHFRLGFEGPLSAVAPIFLSVWIQ